MSYAVSSADPAAPNPAGEPAPTPAGEPVAPLLRALRGLPVEQNPVWFMRQAGRSLPEYRALRRGTPMLQACTDPDQVCEITLQPVRRYGVDAAVLYSDIMVPLKAVGVPVEIQPGVGPVVDPPVRAAGDLAVLRPLEPPDVSYVGTAVRSLVAELGDTPLIGFAGAPFTLATYLVDGGPSKQHPRTKALMFGEPAVWHELMDRLAGIAATFLRVQVEAGAAAVQLFDSWAGTLSRADYSRYVQPHSARVLREVAGLGVPRIHFGVGTGDLLDLFGAAGADAVGVDWRLPLDEASRRLGGRYPLQGNLDPALLLAPWEVLAERARDVLAAGRTAPGHVFNLGHGVLPETDPGVLGRLVDLVHAAPTR